MTDVHARRADVTVTDGGNYYDQISSSASYGRRKNGEKNERKKPWLGAVGLWESFVTVGGRARTTTTTTARFSRERRPPE